MAMKSTLAALAIGAVLVGGSAINGAVAQEIPNQWDGTWAGGSIGYKWLDTDYRGTPNEITELPANGLGIGNEILLTPGTPVSKSGDLSPSGITAGGLLGVNRQRGRWVFGLEGAADFADAEESETKTRDSVADYDGNTTDEIDFANRSETCRTAKDMYFEASLRGRVGYLVSPNTLFFVTGGLSSAAVEHEVDCRSTTSYTDEGGGVPFVTDIHTTRAAGKDDDWEFGWTLGAGAERALGDGTWRARFDYAYVDLGSNSQRVAINRSSTTGTVNNTGPDSISYKWNEDYHKIRFSLVRKFGRSDPPVPLK